MTSMNTQRNVQKAVTFDPLEEQSLCQIMTFSCILSRRKANILQSTQGKREPLTKSTRCSSAVLASTTSIHSPHLALAAHSRDFVLPPCLSPSSHGLIVNFTPNMVNTTNFACVLIPSSFQRNRPWSTIPRPRPQWCPQSLTKPS
jgi:hypothetical protein